MKKLLLTLSIIFSISLAAQDCADLFISGYVEGYSNNRALEIYNPTQSAIDLSGYSIGRFSNGGTDFEGIQLPSTMLAAGDVFVAVLDQTDPEGTGYDEPVWNGYVLLDTLFDSVTGEPIVDNDGNVVIGPQYDAEGGTLYGTVYNADYDLQGLADVFLCPVYETNNAMYFNGNDAVALITGTTINGDGSNILDVIGAIGQDPGDAWVDENGSWLTKDKTLKRNVDIMSGTGAIVAGIDTFNYNQWTIYPKNTFNVIGNHTSNCQTDAIELIANEEIKLTPTITSGSVSITTENFISKIELYNVAGQKVFTKNFNEKATNTNFDIAHLAGGTYMVNVIFDNNTMGYSKIVKQ